MGNNVSEFNSDFWPTITKPMESIVSRVFESVEILYKDTISTVMMKLDDEQNYNLFDLVKFLVWSRSLKQIRPRVREVMDKYGQLVNKIQYSDYKEKAKKAKDRDISDLIWKTSEHQTMRANFNKLNNQEQNNVIYLAWFILYCRLYKLDAPNKHNQWENYCELMVEVRSLLHTIPPS